MTGWPAASRHDRCMSTIAGCPPAKSCEDHRFSFGCGLGPIVNGRIGPPGERDRRLATPVAAASDRVMVNSRRGTARNMAGPHQALELETVDPRDKGAGTKLTGVRCGHAIRLELDRRAPS